jgi:hypothetical protein
MNKPICIYHANCADGFTAAWVMSRFSGQDLDFHPGVYNDAPPDVTGRDVYLVDFSYRRAVVEEMLKTAASITLIDHHKTAVDDLKPLIDSERIDSYVDMNRSGARLAWDFWRLGHPTDSPESIPMLIRVVEDRDLWRFALPHTRELQAVIFSHAYTFENWDFLHVELSSVVGRHDLVEQGIAIERKHFKDVAELTEVVTRPMKIGGHVVPIANLPYTLTSDAGPLLMKRYGAPFAGCYWDTPDGRVFSLRSNDESVDVAAIAKQYGGGGHRNASGFRIPLADVAQFEVS